MNHRNIEILEVMGNATNMIFVPMSDNHAANTLLIFLQITRIRHHNIDAMHAVTGEGKTGIDQHDVVAVFEHTGVLTDFVQTAKGDHPQSGLARAICTWVGIGHQWNVSGESGNAMKRGHTGPEVLRIRPSDRRQRISLGVRWDAGQPGFQRGVVSRLRQRGEGEGEGLRQASHRAPGQL